MGSGGGVASLSGAGGATVLEKISDSCWRAARSFAGIGASGDAGDGCLRMVARSRAAAIARSLEDGTGMTTRVGNHARVSAMRSDLVDHTNTR